MIVSCPSCNARYKIDAAKIKGRGAKITCPRCKQKFVVYKDDDGDGVVAEGAESSDIFDRDFRDVGVTWQVRRSNGLTVDLFDLTTLQGYLESGKVEPRDSLSYDGHSWVPIDAIGDLEAYFEEAWDKGERGEIKPPALSTSSASSGGDDEDDEDDADAPTTIMRHGSSLMDDIRRAVHDATTPAPPQPRQTMPREPIAPEPSEPEPVRQTTPAPAPLRPSQKPMEPTSPRSGLYQDEGGPRRPAEQPGVADPFSKLSEQKQREGEGESSSSLPLILFAGVIFVLVLAVGFAATQGVIPIPGLSPEPVETPDEEAGKTTPPPKEVAPPAGEDADGGDAGGADTPADDAPSGDAPAAEDAPKPTPPAASAPKVAPKPAAPKEAPAAEAPKEAPAAEAPAAEAPKEAEPPAEAPAAEEAKPEGEAEQAAP